MNKPQTIEEFDRLKTLDEKILKELGMRRWDESGLWLFPGEWYNNIPCDFIVTDIFGLSEKFIPGKTDNDTRFGLLAFGIINKN